MTPAQCRAARALVDWSQDMLATAARVSVTSIRNFERGASTPMVNNLSAMTRAFEEAGIIFIPEAGEGPGVRIRRRDFPEWVFEAAQALALRFRDELMDPPERYQVAIGIIKRLFDQAVVDGYGSDEAVRRRVVHLAQTTPLDNFPERALGVD